MRLLIACLLLTFPVCAQTWTPYSTLPDLYPAMAIGLAHFTGDPDVEHSHDLGDPNGLLGISITVPNPNAHVKLTMTCSGGLTLFSPATLEVDIPEADEEYIIAPTIPFNQARLAGIRQLQTAFITYNVTIDGKPQPPRTERLRVQPISVCPFGVREPDGTYTSFAFLFTAYVNEDHPLLDRVLQEALRKKYVDSFVGYQDGPTQVYRQVLALWRVLQDRGLSYSNTTTTVGSPESVASQHVRSVEESLTNTQANCTDGSILLASLLRKIGIEPVLVTVPGHIFVGFDLDEGSTQQAYLETTLLSAPDSTFTIETDPLAQTLLGSVAPANGPDELATERFIAAIQAGNRRFKADQNALETGRPDYSITHIFEAREAGVMPIPAPDRPASAK